MTKKAIQKLEKQFDYLNAKYWNSQLPKIKIEISDIKNCYGEYQEPTNYDKDCYENYKITINARLHWRTKTSMRSTLLHEMCHHALFINNKEKYWNKKIQWHGKEWRREMERVGFKKPIRATT